MADVKIRYEFLPTEDSIRKSAEKVVNQLNKSVGKPISAVQGKKLKTEFENIKEDANPGNIVLGILGLAIACLVLSFI